MGIRLITVFLQPNYVRDYKMEMYRDTYLQHMEVLEGKLDDKKVEYISEHNKKIRELTEQDTSVDQYKKGEITEEEFNESYRLRITGYKQKDEFTVINERFQSVLNNPERVYFIYSNGWTALIGNENIDFVMLLLLMVLIVPMICNEFSTDMYPVLRTTLNGGARLYLSKYAVGIVTSILVSVLFFFEEYIYFAAMFGLPCCSFPLQSLAPFESSPYQISIMEAAALTLVNHCIAAIYMTTLLICLSVLFKRSLSAVFIGTLTVLFPFILFSESTMKYLLPTPLGFLLSSGFLKGYFPVTPFSSKYASISFEQYIYTILISFLIMAVLFIVGLVAYSGKKFHFKKNLALLLCIPLLFMTGCNKQSTEFNFNGFVYDKWSYQPVSDKYSVIYDETNNAYISNNENNILQPLIRDCFVDTNDFSMAVMSFIDGDTVYYLNQYQNYFYEIIALNTNDFSEKSIHKVEWSDNIEEMDMLFGLGFYLPKKMQQDEIVDSFFVHDNQLFLSKSHGVFWYDLNTGKQICIYDKKADNLAFTCNSVYYLDEVLDVYRYDIISKSTVKLPIGKAERFYAVENGLYYKDIIKDCFYYVNYDGSDNKLLNDFDENEFLRRYKDE